MSNHSEKLRLAGIKRHGSEQAWREFLRQSGNKARRDTPRGFTVLKEKNPKLLSKISKKGGKARWKPHAGD